MADRLVLVSRSEKHVRAGHPVTPTILRRPQTGAIRVSPETRPKSASLLARLVRPWASIAATIRESPMSSSYFWLTRVAASTRGLSHRVNLDSQERDSRDGLNVGAELGNLGG